jgi:hypothetical protein
MYAPLAPLTYVVTIWSIMFNGEKFGIFPIEGLIWLSQDTLIVSVGRIKWFVFIVEAQTVVYVERIGF